MVIGDGTLLGHTGFIQEKNAAEYPKLRCHRSQFQLSGVRSGFLLSKWVSVHGKCLFWIPGYFFLTA